MSADEPDVLAVRAIAEASILMSIAFVGTIFGGFLLTVWLRLPALFPPPWNLLGVPVGAAGGASLVYCGAFLSRHGKGTPYPRRPPNFLVTMGPFARVRNPIIVSWGVVMVGIGIATSWTGLLVVMAPAFAIIQAYLVYHEEPILRRRFPSEYDAYRARVPRWIPRLR